MNLHHEIHLSQMNASTPFLRKKKKKKTKDFSNFHITEANTRCKASYRALEVISRGNIGAFIAAAESPQLVEQTEARWFYIFN